MKTTSLVFALGLLSHSLFAETVTLVAIAPSASQTAQSATITLAANDVATLIYKGIATPGIVYITTGGGTFSANTADRPVVVGPASIYLSVSSGTGGGARDFVTFQIQRAADQFVPSNSVVIPADNLGPVTIILESSTDLLTWTPSLPGTYGTTTTKRFFRVRAQR